jgi:hypothetical protein
VDKKELESQQQHHKPQKLVERLLLKMLKNVSLIKIQRRRTIALKGTIIIKRLFLKQMLSCYIRN